MEAYLRPGFRFYPTEEELVSFYLPKKIEGRRQDLDLVIPVLYIYQFNPCDLPQFAGPLCRKDPEQWFFFIPRQEREVRGGRPNRLTTSGYWKATGSPGYVFSSNNQIIGEKRTMVFYKGKAPTGRKTEWKMNEYRAIEGEAQLRQEFSLCRVYIKSKCLRAFDRRPSAPVITTDAVISQPADHHHHGDHDQDQVSTSHQNINPTGMESIVTTTSPDQSSSGDHANPDSQNVANDQNQNFGMDVDNIYNEALWDWEHFNLL